jgi:hypothetical protein
MYKKIVKLFLLLVLMNSTLYGALTKTEVSELYVTLMGRVSEGKGSNYWQSNYSDQTEAAKAMLGSDAVAKYFDVSSMEDMSNENFIGTIVTSHFLPKNLPTTTNSNPNRLTQTRNISTPHQSIFQIIKK